MRIALYHFYTLVIKYFEIIYIYIYIFLRLSGEKRFVNSVKVVPASIKLINAIQKYPHIIESYACILKKFIVMFLFCKAEDKGRLINILISFVYVLHQKIRNKKIVIMNIQRKLMSSNIRVIIKIY